MNRFVCCVVLGFALLGSVSCGDTVSPDPAQPVVPPVVPPQVPPSPPAVATVVLIQSSSRFRVGSERMIEAVAQSENGETLDGRTIVFTTSDNSIARLTPRGAGLVMVSALKRGTVTITATSEGVSVAEALTISAAALAIKPAVDHLAIGQSVQLSARLLDVRGNELPEQDRVYWSMHGSQSATVSESGIITGLAVSQRLNAWVIAQADGLRDSIMVATYPIVAGQPATLRVVHAASGLAPVTFRISNGTSVTIAFGESRNLEVPSGGYRVDGEAPRALRSPPPTASAMIAPNEQSTFYLTGDATWVGMHAVLDAHASIASDEAVVRVMIAGGMPGYDGMAVYMTRPGDAIRDDILTYCDDLYSESSYSKRAADPFDIVITSPASGCRVIGSIELGRFTVEPEPGRAATYVITAEYVDQPSHNPIIYKLIKIVDR
jgi:hypothetical protein